MNNPAIITFIVTTYKRQEKLIRLLRSFSSPLFLNFNNISLFVYDDDPASKFSTAVKEIASISNIPITYVINERNYGQGPNLIQAIERHIDSSDYFWSPGDDDTIDPVHFAEVLKYVQEFRPACACFEFRQGCELESGTFFDKTELCFDLNSQIERVIRFGKGTSCIYRAPDRHFLKFLKSKLSKSMYQDKAIAVYSVLLFGKCGTFVYSKLTAFANNDHWKFRYSVRVFANLSITVNCVIRYSRKLGITPLPCELRAAWYTPSYWWCHGLIWHFSRSHPFCYGRKLLLKELFAMPFILIVTIPFSSRRFQS